MGFLGLSGQWRVECTIHYRQVADAGEDYNLKSISFDLVSARHQTLQTLDHSQLSDMKINILPPQCWSHATLSLHIPAANPQLQIYFRIKNEQGLHIYFLIHLSINLRSVVGRSTEQLNYFWFHLNQLSNPQCQRWFDTRAPPLILEVLECYGSIIV